MHVIAGDEVRSAPLRAAGLGVLCPVHGDEVRRLRVGDAAHACSSARVKASVGCAPGTAHCMSSTKVGTEFSPRDAA